MGDNLSYVFLGVNRTAKQLALGRLHSCALLDNNEVKCKVFFVFKKKREEINSIDCNRF